MYTFLQFNADVCKILGIEFFFRYSKTLNKCIFSEWWLLIIASKRAVKQGQTKEDVKSALRCWILSAAKIK